MPLIQIDKVIKLFYGVEDDVLNEVDNVMGLAAFLEFARTATINWYI